jgi:hypothetical protein
MRGVLASVSVDDWVWTDERTEHGYIESAKVRGVGDDSIDVEIPAGRETVMMTLEPGEFTLTKQELKERM